MLELQKNLAGVGQFAVGRENVTAPSQMFSHGNSQPFSISARNNYRFLILGWAGNPSRSRHVLSRKKPPPLNLTSNLNQRVFLQGTVAALPSSHPSRR
jgi:hypothetical protein